MADLKTLRLASIQLTEALLDGYVRYQRVLLRELAQPGEGTWAGRFAFAHGTASADCGLDALELQRVKVLAAEFCGKRSAWLQVQQRLVEAEQAVAVAQAHGRPPPEKEAALLERARGELARLEDFADFAARYGEAALALLRGRDLELVTLHRELARLEGGGEGHLHVAPGPARG